MSLAKTTLPAIPPSQFTRLRHDDYSAYEFEALGYVCSFLSFDPGRVTRVFADALLSLTYNLPHKHRDSSAHVLFLILLARAVVSMVRRCEIECLSRREPQFAADADEELGSLLDDIEAVRRSLGVSE